MCARSRAGSLTAVCPSVHGGRGCVREHQRSTLTRSPPSSRARMPSRSILRVADALLQLVSDRPAAGAAGLAFAHRGLVAGVLVAPLAVAHEVGRIAAQLR